MVSHLAVETVGYVRVVRLDRPERKNALTSSLGWSIVRAIGDADADDRVRVVALTGNGLHSEDGQEAVQAIIDKRRPEFRGR